MNRVTWGNSAHGVIPPNLIPFFFKTIKDQEKDKIQKKYLYSNEDYCTNFILKLFLYNIFDFFPSKCIKIGLRKNSIFSWKKFDF